VEVFAEVFAEVFVEKVFVEEVFEGGVCGGKCCSCVVVGVWELCECVGRMKKRGNGHDAGLTRCRDQMRARCCTETTSVS